MRTREEIMDAVGERYLEHWETFESINNKLLLEVLLDIRDLLKKNSIEKYEVRIK